MNRSIFGASIQGFSHKKSNLPCQDNFAIRDRLFSYDKASVKNGYYVDLPEDISIVAVADGHGSSGSPYSKTGAQIAVNVFCDIMAEFCFKFKDDMESLEYQFRKESELIHIAKAIEIDWKKRVQLDYSRNKSKRTEVLTEVDEEDEYNIWRLYGTTLIGMLLTDRFAFSFQIGDGDLTFVSKDTVETIIESDKILGVETHSLSKRGAWSHAKASLNYMSEYKVFPFMFMLSTDGFINSHVTIDDFKMSCKGYLNAINEYGIDKVKDNLPNWLDEISEQGCGDDTTVVIAYYSE